jgi:hypothetical protein
MCLGTWTPLLQIWWRCSKELFDVLEVCVKYLTRDLDRNCCIPKNVKIPSHGIYLLAPEKMKRPPKFSW